MAKFLIDECMMVKNVHPANILLAKVHTYVASYSCQVFNNIYHMYYGIVPVPMSIRLNENNNIKHL